MDISTPPASDSNDVTVTDPSDDAAQWSPEVERANRRAAELLCTGEPVLIDVRPAIEVVPGLDSRTILTSGATLPWEQYTGGQRAAIIGGALYEGLAIDANRAETMLHSRAIQVAGCQDFDCIGSLAGVTTASMPVMVVEDAVAGNRAFCTLFEGSSPARLNYGVYNEEVERTLHHLERVIGPALGEAVRRSGGIQLSPIIRRALHMGDELHSRNTAATLLFVRELLPHLSAMARDGAGPELDNLVAYLRDGDYFFLRASMAAAKTTVDRIIGLEHSSVIAAMTFSCKEFAIRVAGLGREWLRGPLPEMDTGTLFEGHGADEIEFMGGESPVTEVSGLGGFAQAAAFPLQSYQGGSGERMIATNLEMYDITVAEHPRYRIPYFGYRGVPVGIDVCRVISTGIRPAMDIGIAGRGGGQIGAGCFRAPMECFESALAAFEARYGKAGAATGSVAAGSQ
ncbi:MAG: DUF1116 domain-containing protein [Solirubrobacteraceae bacterium]